ncbi:MAG: CPBP family intramembrane metalloprotease [bacterium]
MKKLPWHRGRNIEPMIPAVILAAGFWFMLFSPWTKSLVNFWGTMALAASLLTVYAVAVDRQGIRQSFSFRAIYLLIGPAAAALLYFIFFAGYKVATAILPTAGSMVGNIYSTKMQATPWLIAVLLLFLIGPAEEIFWRGFVQRRLSIWFSQGRSPQQSGWKGFMLATALYALVHIWSGNLMLFGAAAVCGAFWGLIYMRFKSVWPGLISHALWDVAIFVVWPIN